MLDVTYAAPLGELCEKQLDSSCRASVVLMPIGALVCEYSPPKGEGWGALTLCLVLGGGGEQGLNL